MTLHPPLIVILGPTTSGKSTLALELADHFSGYIISADSRQVYRGMDIGTAKPSQGERQRVPHFLIDVVNPDEAFTVANYQRIVMDVLKNQAGLPFLVGGTGLYIDAVTENWDIPKGTTEALRSQLDGKSLDILVARLRNVDPESTSHIDLKNKRRVIRALEVAEQTEESFVGQKKKRPLPYRVLKIGVDVPRDELVRRMNTRVDDMMARGLLEEVRRLGEHYGWDTPALTGIGYRQLGQYVRGEMPLDAAVERIKIETRQYAKRQMTWFRRDPAIQWIRTEQEAEQKIKEFLR